MAAISGVLLDASGQPISSPKELRARNQALIQAEAQRQFNTLLKQRQMLKAKYDAAQTFTANENHWGNADHLDPHSVASLHVRRTLRSRSRYEVIENNPYLKGTILTIANDFVGRGPRLHITDPRLSPNRRRNIALKFQEWAKIVRLRQKLWRMRVAKIVDGESFAMFYNNKNRRRKYPLSLDLYLIECDRISGPSTAHPTGGFAEIDGLRFDSYENPVAYYVLYQHPGGTALADFALRQKDNGKWVDADNMLHWFRQDRGWLRGIPEVAPSLPLCALLRRYTLATVRNAEVVTDMTVLLETQNPASPTPWTDGSGNLLVDDPFDLFPLEMGMGMTLPMGYKATQLEGIPLGHQFDAFVGSLLREITRPLMITYNVAAGTSSDSNMASGVLDHHIYKGGQEAERYNAEEDVLDAIFEKWWQEARLTYGYLGDNFVSSDRNFADLAPVHRWGWDEIGVEHTDPQKVAEALKVLHDKRFITDRDIQEGRMNRNVEDWRAEVEEDEAFRAKLEPINPEDRQPEPAPDAGGSGSPPKKAKPKAKTAKKTPRK